MCLGSAKDAALASHWGDREQRREEDYTAVDTAQSQERHWPTGQSRRRHHPGLAPDWLRAHAHFHSALAQRLLRQLIRTHPTASRCSLVLRYIGFSSLVSLLWKGATHHPRLRTSRTIIRHLKVQLYRLFTFSWSDPYYLLCLSCLSCQSIGH